jgi:hypothetical protein
MKFSARYMIFGWVLNGELDCGVQRDILCRGTPVAMTGPQNDLLDKHLKDP